MYKNIYLASNNKYVKKHFIWFGPENRNLIKKNSLNAFSTTQKKKD